MGETVTFNEPHAPHGNAIDAFGIVEHEIKRELLHLRHDWDKHEPRMFARVAHMSDADLSAWTVQDDLVLVRSALTSYGTIILGKIKVLTDDQGEGFIHVRIHDPPDRGAQDVKFHSLFTDEGPVDKKGHHTKWKAIQSREEPLVLFNE